MVSENKAPSIWAVIPAAGIGSRMASDRPKQYLPLLGKPIIEHTIAVFDRHPAIGGIVVVLAEDDPYWPQLGLSAKTPLHTVVGGAERSESVLNGLVYLNQHHPDTQWVMVHDAARPCLQPSDIDKLVAVAQSDKAVGAILGHRVVDTVKKVNADLEIEGTVAREQLFRAFTPQMFRVRQLLTAIHSALNADLNVTDDSYAIEKSGQSPILLEGAASNIKVTGPEDLALAEFFLSQIQQGQTQ